MGGEDLLHAAGGEAVAGDIDDVVDATHDEEVAVLVLHARIASQVVTRLGAEVGLDVAVVVLPQGRKTGRRQG